MFVIEKLIENDWLYICFDFSDISHLILAEYCVLQGLMVCINLCLVTKLPKEIVAYFMVYIGNL